MSKLSSTGQRHAKKTGPLSISVANSPHKSPPPPPPKTIPPVAPCGAAGETSQQAIPAPHQPGTPLLAVLVYHVADASGVLHLPAKPVMHRSAYSSRLITRYTVASPACQPNRATRGTSPRPPLKPHFTGRKRGLRDAMGPCSRRSPDRCISGT